MSSARRASSTRGAPHAAPASAASRLRASPVAALALACACSSSCGGAEQSTPPPAPSRAVARATGEGAIDPAAGARLAAWGARRGCPPFLGDTSDLAPALAKRLLDGSRDTLRWARGELMRGGPDCVAALEKLVAENLPEPAHATRVVAALEVLGSRTDDAGRVAATRALGHPADSVRIAALAVLRNHPDPADWDAIHALLPGASDDLRQHARAALGRSDPRRTALLALAEVRGGFGDERLCAGLSARGDEELLAQLRASLPSASGAVAVHLLASLAAAGDELARKDLLALLVEESVVQRQNAATACAEAGLRELLLEARDDADESIRLLCVKQLADGVVQGSLEFLRDALDDPAAEPRAAALEALAALGDRQAVDRGVAMLAGTTDDRNLALRSLRPLFERDAELRARVLDRLFELRPPEAGAARREIDRALALVPDERAARALAEAARGDSELVQGRSAHRFYCDLLGGMGRAGLDRLRELRADERDVARRVDIAWAMSFGRDDPARAALQGVLDEARAHPAERFLAAELLVRLGPASSIAPRLKRAAMSIDEPAWRGAFNCLLWDSYAK
ncbi:MAG: hypothetical protein RL112_1690 [Planctomycetota bacterium]